MTMQIEAGKSYRTRDGRKVGPMRSWPNKRFIVQPGDGHLWADDGANVIANNWPDQQLDLVAEWVDETATPSPSYTAEDVERLVAAALSAREELEEYEAERTGESYNSPSLNEALAPFLPQPKTCPNCGQKIEDQP